MLHCCLQALITVAVSMADKLSSAAAQRFRFRPIGSEQPSSHVSTHSSLSWSRFNVNDAFSLPDVGPVGLCQLSSDRSVRHLLIWKGIKLETTTKKITLWGRETLDPSFFNPGQKHKFNHLLILSTLK